MTKTNPIAQLLADMEAKKKPRKTKQPYRKPASVMQLEEMNHAYRMKRYSGVPHLDYKKFSDRTANDLTKSIIKFIELKGGQAERISVTGRYMVAQKKWIPSSMKKGSGDISAVIKGKAVKFEVKIGKDTQSEDQKKYQQGIENAGGVYFIVKSFDDFLQKYNTLL